MSLRFIYGRSGTGKTTYCFNEIKKLIDKYKKVYIITPEQFSFTAENNLMKICEKKSIVNAEVITFERMAHRIINEVGGITNTGITNAGKSMLLTSIIEKQKESLNFLGKTDKNLDLTIRIITELKKNNVSTQILEENTKNIEDNYLKLKLKDINLLYSKFNEEISNKYLDDDDLLTIVKDKIKESEMFKNSYIFQYSASRIVIILEVESIKKWKETLIELEENISNLFNIDIIIENSLLDKDPIKIKDTFNKLKKNVIEKSKKTPIVLEVQKYINRNYYNPDLSIEALSNRLGISQTYLTRLLKKELGMNFIDYLTYVRLQNSIELMKDPSIKIYEIANLVGYSTQHYFSNVFKKHMKISPNDYRMCINNEDKV